jgi:hypothetical protein
MIYGRLIVSGALGGPYCIRHCPIIGAQGFGKENTGESSWDS